MGIRTSMKIAKLIPLFWDTVETSACVGNMGTHDWKSALFSMEYIRNMEPQQSTTWVVSKEFYITFYIKISITLNKILHTLRKIAQGRNKNITQIFQTVKPVSSQDTSCDKADRVQGLGTFSTSIFDQFWYLKGIKSLKCVQNYWNYTSSSLSHVLFQVRMGIINNNSCKS